MERNTDICKHIGLPPNPEVQRLYDAMMDAKAAERAASDAWVKSVDAARGQMPLFDRLVFAAYNRCPCGAGLAYDPIGGHYWDCSAILLGTADTEAKHSGQLPFAYYEIKSEGQPSANGATTRPAPHGAAEARGEGIG